MRRRKKREREERVKTNDGIHHLGNRVEMWMAIAIAVQFIVVTATDKEKKPKCIRESCKNVHCGAPSFWSYRLTSDKVFVLYIVNLCDFCFHAWAFFCQPFQLMSSVNTIQTVVKHSPLNLYSLSHRSIVMTYLWFMQ